MALEVLEDSFLDALVAGDKVWIRDDDSVEGRICPDQVR